jgi:hypothetical protein
MRRPRIFGGPPAARPRHGPRMIGPEYDPATEFPRAVGRAERAAEQSPALHLGIRLRIRFPGAATSIVDATSDQLYCIARFGGSPLEHDCGPDCPIECLAGWVNLLEDLMPSGWGGGGVAVEIKPVLLERDMPDRATPGQLRNEWPAPARITYGDLPGPFEHDITPFPAELAGESTSPRDAAADGRDFVESSSGIPFRIRPQVPVELASCGCPYGIGGIWHREGTCTDPVVARLGWYTSAPVGITHPLAGPLGAWTSKPEPFEIVTRDKPAAAAAPVGAHPYQGFSGYGSGCVTCGRPPGGHDSNGPGAELGELAAAAAATDRPDSGHDQETPPDAPAGPAGRPGPVAPDSQEHRD